MAGSVCPPPRGLWARGEGVRSSSVGPDPRACSQFAFLHHFRRVFSGLSVGLERAEKEKTRWSAGGVADFSQLWSMHVVFLFLRRSPVLILLFLFFSCARGGASAGVKAPVSREQPPRPTPGDQRSPQPSPRALLCEDAFWIGLGPGKAKTLKRLRGRCPGTAGWRGGGLRGGGPGLAGCGMRKCHGMCSARGSPALLPRRVRLEPPMPV